MAVSSNSYGFTQPQYQLPYRPPSYPSTGMMDGLPYLPRTPEMQGSYGVPGGMTGMLDMLNSRFTGASLWGDKEARGAGKSELENWLMPMLQLLMNQRSQTYEQELGRYNAYEQAYINRANVRNADWQQRREDAAFRAGQDRWSAEFGEAGRQFDIGTELTREAGQRELDIMRMQDELARWQTGENLGWNREQLAAQDALQRWQTGQERGMQREGFRHAEDILGLQQGFTGSQAALDRAQQERMQAAGFGQERWALGQQLGFQGRESAANRALQRQMQQAGFGQDRWALQQQLGMRREELGQNQSQFQRQMRLQERENQQRYGARGLENRQLDAQIRDARAGRELQERMQRAGFRQESSLFDRQAELERERMRSQEQQARWSQFGRAQTPSTNWARNWG